MRPWVPSPPQKSMSTSAVPCHQSGAHSSRCPAFSPSLFCHCRSVVFDYVPSLLGPMRCREARDGRREPAELQHVVTITIRCSMLICSLKFQHWQKPSFWLALHNTYAVYASGGRPRQNHDGVHSTSARIEMVSLVLASGKEPYFLAQEMALLPSACSLFLVRSSYQANLLYPCRRGEQNGLVLIEASFSSYVRQPAICGVKEQRYRLLFEARQSHRWHRVRLSGS